MESEKRLINFYGPSPDIVKSLSFKKFIFSRRKRATLEAPFVAMKKRFLKKACSEWLD